MDIDSPLSYEFSYQIQGNKVIFFYHKMASGQAISETDWLGIGDEEDEYRLNVTVQIKDSFGSKSAQVMTVQVCNHFTG